MRIAGIAARFVLAYGLLMLPWPGAVEAYGRAYAAAARVLFESANPERSVRIRHVALQPGASNRGTAQDTEVRLEIRGIKVGSRTVPPFGTLRSSHYTGFVPAAFGVALVAATPLPWRRRAWALAGVLLLASAFSASMLAIWIHGWFYWHECAWLATFSPRHASIATVVGRLMELTTWPGPYYIAPVFIWMLVSFRREDLESITRAASFGRERPTPDHQEHQAEQKGAE